MNRTQKAAVVDQLRERLTKSPNMYLTDFTGIAVKPMTELRSKMRSLGVDYVVVKNTLALRALQEASVSGVEGEFAGPTGFVFTGDDPVAAAKLIMDFQKEHKTLTVKAGLLDGERVGPAEVKRLASLPSHDQMLGQVAGLMQGPLQGFVGALGGLLYELVGALDALRTQRASAEPQA
jgi:large subunit ribosomal protein L10